MRRLVVVAIALSILLGGGSASGDGTQSEISELRQMLERLSARVDALEKEGDTDELRELEQIRLLLDSLRDRIEALEEQVVEAPQADPERPVPPSAVDSERDHELEFYGSLRVRVLYGEGGDVELIDRFSRAGVAARYQGGKRWSVLGRFEAGMNLVNQNPSLEVGGDPGFSFGKGSDAFSTRLGFVGVDTPAGRITWGKQWGVYYDVAEFTDQYFTYGGEASGAYAQGDGGINGTGRAETAVQYRYEIGPVQLGLQVQNRSRTERDRHYADTFGSSVRWKVTPGLTIGAAYNEVRDGVADPMPNEPHLGDRALIAGGTWQSDDWIVAATYALGEQRERDDEGTFFDNRGFEAFVLRKIDSRWSVFGGLNWLEPDDSAYNGNYELAVFLAGVEYRVNPAVVISGEGRIDDSVAANGDSLRNSSLALGVNIGW